MRSLKEGTSDSLFVISKSFQQHRDEAKSRWDKVIILCLRPCSNKERDTVDYDSSGGRWSHS
jgi:hypothetical protein